MRWLRRTLGSSNEPEGQPVSAEVPEQALLIRIYSESVPEDFGLDLIEDPLAAELADSGLGEYDGHESGPQATVIYLYGPDARALLDLVVAMSEEGRLVLPTGSTAEVRLGPPGAETETVALT
jgi:hypothetical protein